MKSRLIIVLFTVLAALTLLCGFALAEGTDEGVGALPSGDTVFETNGISVRYNKYNFKCDMDGHGDLVLTYLGESDYPVRIGVRYLEGNTVDDVLDGMKETIRDNNADVSTDNFGDNVKNATSVTWQKRDGNKILDYQTTVIPKKNGVYVLSIESFRTGDEESDMDRTAMIEEIVDSVRLTGRSVREERPAEAA